MKFAIDKVKTPEVKLVPITPEGEETIHFKLSAFNTDMAFDVNRYKLSRTPDEAMRVQFQIGVQRIVGWEGVEDGEGEPIEFNGDNLLYITALPEFIPYAMEIGDLTIDEADALSEKKSAKKSTAKSNKKPASKKTTEV